MSRLNNRGARELRKVTLITGVSKYAEGSCLASIGDTKVLITASIEDRVPSFLKGSETGWVTAEYSMLPRSCKQRTQRDSVKGNISGRSQEIQRLVGRSLRAVTDMSNFGERTITLDCDVIQGDGGTRCISVTGAYVALYQATRWMMKEGIIETEPLNGMVAAVSVGLLHGEPILDLCYEEDSEAEVDMNVVMTDAGRFVEVQGTAEGETFSKEQMNHMLDMAQNGINELFQLQKQAITNIGYEPEGMEMYERS